MVDAHEQKITNRYTVNYPAHEPRQDDPHLHEFREFKRRRKTDGTYHCDFAQRHRGGDTSECDLTRPLESHHSHIEYALQNGVDIGLLEADFPGISKPQIGEWLDSPNNLELLCVAHHRGHGGKHKASVADFEGEKYVRGLIS
ncbi:MAG: hypothetical protein ACRDRN_16830 [Sciscionella sp.]